MIDWKLVLCRQIRVNRSQAYAKTGASAINDSTVLNQLRRNELDAVGGNGEANAVGRSFKLGIDGSRSRHTDQVAAQIDQRASAVARIDGRVGLDSIGNLLH